MPSAEPGRLVPKNRNNRAPEDANVTKFGFDGCSLLGTGAVGVLALLLVV
jgi:hypothetical protein